MCYIFTLRKAQNKIGLREDDTKGCKFHVEA